MPRNIQIAHLRAFVTVARLGSFTRAAEEMGYTEPAVHLQVRSLRDALGGPVLEYRGGRMELTSLGETLLPYAATSISNVDQLITAANGHEATGRSVLRVAVGRGTGDYLFPRLAAAFRKLHPNVLLEFHSLPGPEIVKSVSESTSDVGFAARLKQYLAESGIGHHNYAVAPWLHLHQIVAGQPGILDRIRGADGTVPIAVPTYYSTGLEQRLSAIFRDTGLTPRVQILDTTEAAKSLALLGDAVAYIPVCAATLELEFGRLEPILPEMPMPHTPIYIMHRRPSTNPAVGALVEFLRQERHAVARWNTLLQEPFDHPRPRSNVYARGL